MPYKVSYPCDVFVLHVYSSIRRNIGYDLFRSKPEDFENTQTYFKGSFTLRCDFLHKQNIRTCHT
jgi:hypothetical protein